ncbi:cytochrome P450 [Polyplosphaeria fusca]|uniref:Cytochrome P450 n=1 Tax=Polyplosphaeria fusca TaxID=682080 RepID=A0A9P4V2U1_9PLEO|nr:cytochrome P450 [Polyplosphaeria fusca]
MGPPLATTLPTTAVVSAILLHHLILKRFEIDHLVLHLTATSWAAYAGLVSVVGLQLATSTAFSFFAILSVTILVYRAFFHPLRDFPGPFPAKLTKFWAVWKTWDSKFAFFKQVHPELRRQYGDYVRTGPREISIFDVKGIQPVLGFTSKMEKGPYYDVFERSLHLNRDHIWHRQRRKVWDNGMKQSLSDYGPRVEEFTSELLDRIERTNGQSVTLNEFCIHYSYDVMSALVFGRSMGFNTGQSSDVANRIIQIIADSLHALGLMCHIPWLMKALGTLLSSAGPMALWEDWTRDQLAERRALKDPRPDFMMHLLEGTPRSPQGDRLLFGESRLIISAGSDTTANSLTCIFIQLALHPHLVKELRQELECGGYSCLRPQPVLDSIINESMRVWPAVFFPSQRVTPPEGLQIPGGRFIPGNMIVTIPAFALARDERNFARPDEFLPERWTTRPELAMTKTAFLPFLIGPYTCAGKSLAMMELRSVTARVMAEYDVVLPEDFDATKFFGGIEDHWTTGVPKQKVRFVKIAK